MDNKPFCQWIEENCDSYVENEVEKDALWCLGIKAKAVIPSFLGEINDYPFQELRTDKERYYTSVSGDDFKLYGWDKIPSLANANPHVEYHLYGNTTEWTCDQENVIIHGRIPQRDMNEQVQSMTGALRLTTFDGASEILIKSTLWGQKPQSPYIHYDWLGDKQKLLQVLNKYPWASN